MTASELCSDGFDEAPNGVLRHSFTSPRVNWKFAHQFPPPEELKHGSATTAYIVLWEGDGRGSEWLDAHWEEIYNTWENDDCWDGGFGDGFVLQETLVEWDGPVPDVKELEVMAGKSLMVPIQFDELWWSHIRTYEHIDMGVWNSGHGLFVDISGEDCLVSVVGMMRNANDSISVDIESVDIDGEGDRCVQVVVPLDQFREQYQRAVPPRMKREKEVPDRPVEETYRFF